MNSTDTYHTEHYNSLVDYIHPTIDHNFIFDVEDSIIFFISLI